MATNHAHSGQQMQRLSELGGYTVESGDPDPRGWAVVDATGARLGKVTDLMVDTSAMKVRQVVVDLDEGDGSAASPVAFDMDGVEIRPSTREVVATRATGGTTGVAAFSAGRDAAAGTEATRRLTRSEEELRIGTREVARGEARIAKHVETEHISQPVTRKREELVVERRPVEAGARADATITSDEVRIPLMEEEVVVEKRPVVKEELIVGKRIVEDREVVETDVRREEFDIDRGVEVTSPTEPRRQGR